MKKLLLLAFICCIFAAGATMVGCSKSIDQEMPVKFDK